jgi:uncharacterized protein YjbJ (UPF0337 family)
MIMRGRFGRGLAVGLLCLGGLFTAGCGEDSEDGGSLTSEVGDVTDKVTEEAKDAANDAEGAAKDAANDAEDAAKDAADDAEGAAKDAANDAAKEVDEHTDHDAEGN